MPTNTPIPTVSTGNVIAASTQNDMAVLNTDVGLFGIHATMSGAAPPINAPNFQIQAGAPTLGFVAGAAGLTFPNAFPTGVLSITFSLNDSTVSDAPTFSWSGASASSVTVNLHVAGGSASGNYQISYIAIGF